MIENLPFLNDGRISECYKGGEAVQLHDDTTMFSSVTFWVRILDWLVREWRNVTHTEHSFCAGWQHRHHSSGRLTCVYQCGGRSCQTWSWQTWDEWGNEATDEHWDRNQWPQQACWGCADGQTCESWAAYLTGHTWPQTSSQRSHGGWTASPGLFLCLARGNPSCLGWCDPYKGMRSGHYHTRCRKRQWRA